MVNSRLVIISLTSNLAAHQCGKRPESVNTDGPGGPIEPKGHDMPVRDSVARCPGCTERMIEGQLVELVAEEPVELATEIAVQSNSSVTRDVSGCVIRRACVMRALPG